MARRTRGSQRTGEVRHRRDRPKPQAYVWIFDRKTGKRIGYRRGDTIQIAFERAIDFLAQSPRGRHGDEFHITDEYAWRMNDG